MQAHLPSSKYFIFVIYIKLYYNKPGYTIFSRYLKIVITLDINYRA